MSEQQNNPDQTPVLETSDEKKVKLKIAWKEGIIDPIAIMELFIDNKLVSTKEESFDELKEFK